MRPPIVALGLLVGTTSAVAQAPGFIAFSVTGLGSAGGATGVVGESRLPVRVGDVSSTGGELRVSATSSRASIRRIVLGISNPVSGQRYEVGEGATLTVRFASGNERAPAPGRGWIEVDQATPTRVTGTFEGSFPQGRIPIELRGRFEAPLR